MRFEELAAAIDKEVDRIKQEIRTEYAAASIKHPFLKQRALAFIPSYITEKDIIKRIHDESQNTEIDFASAGRAYEGKRGIKRILDISNIETRIDIAGRLDSYKKTIIVNPTIAFLKRVITTDESCFMASMVYEGLLRGKEIQAYLGFSETGAISLRAFLGAHDTLKTAKAMGIKMIAPRAETETKPRRLLTEQDIMDIYRNGGKQVDLAKGCIVTPLAKDTAKEKKIVLNYGRY